MKDKIEDKQRFDINNPLNNSQENHLYIYLYIARKFIFYYVLLFVAKDLKWKIHQKIKNSL